MKKTIKKLLAILALLLVCATGFAQWPTNTFTTTIGPGDLWFFVSPLMARDLYIGGTTGSNGTVWINGSILAPAGQLSETNLTYLQQQVASLNALVAALMTNAVNSTTDVLVADGLGGFSTQRWIFTTGSRKQ